MTQKRLRFGDPGYGPVCPRCGGRKSPEASRCRDCSPSRVARNLRGVRNAGKDLGLYETGRHESIVTFQERETGQLATRFCAGEGVDAQIESGRAKLPEGEWEVASRSTPETILQDVRGEDRKGRKRRGSFLARKPGPKPRT